MICAKIIKMRVNLFKLCIENCGLYFPCTRCILFCVLFAQLQKTSCLHAVCCEDNVQYTNYENC